MVWNIVATPNLKKIESFPMQYEWQAKKEGRWSILPDKEDKKF